ncbi:DUF748 domain-containing protein [Psychromonas sp.]|uniref:DUF748 domain-containing protein n=1 Tax=Psychromonas sp. TaxID=1884585 RepID=UPI003562E9FB
MKQLQKMFSRFFYRSPLFWAVILLGSYTFGGFIILPKVVKSKIIEQVEVNLGWQTTIDNVTFNPYTFILDIDNLAIQDQQNKTVIAFAQYHADFEVRSLFEGAFTFAEMKLSGPAVNLLIDKNGVTNLQLAVQQQAAKSEKIDDEQTKADAALVKLLFDNIAIADGAVNIVDHSPQNTVKHHIAPLNFSLKNFSTYAADDDAEYQLSLSLGKAQTLKLTGVVGMAPIDSSGEIDIAGIKAHQFWDYVVQQSPYNLLHGLANVKANYRFSMENDIPEFALFDSSIDLQQLKVALKEEPHSFMDIESVALDSLVFNLAQQLVQIKAVNINDINLQIERDKQGQLTFLAPFASQSEPASNEQNTTTAEENHFKWSINNITVSNSRVNIVDKVPATEAQIAINKINFDLLQLDQTLTNPLPFNLSYQINDSEVNKVKGQVTPTPLNLTAAINLNAIDLTSLQPYLNDIARINIEQGKLSLAGDLHLLVDAQGKTQGNFAGAVNVLNFNTKDKIARKRLVGWQKLAVEPFTVNFTPLSINIDKISLSEPYSRLVVTEDRSLNFAQLLQTPAAQQNSSLAQEKAESKAVAKKPAATEKESEQPLDLTISEIEFVNGNAFFADLSLQPEFATAIENINGNISGLSMNNLERADIDITGNVDEYGKMFVDGKINPLSGDLYTDINVKFEKIELPTLTPYSGRYAGYVINKGKLNLELNYQIAQRQLNGSNRMILEHFELGNKVNSPEAVNLPLKLAVALFKDRNGIIDISLPTKGDMDSPDFAVGGLLLKAFMNVMTKAVTSPFSMLANLAGGDDSQLNQAAFDFGQSSLTTQQLTNLDSLAEVLIKRPQLILEIHASVDKEKDGLALKEQKLTEKLNAQAGDNAQQEKRISTMETMLNNLSGQGTVDALKAQLTASQTEVRPEAAGAEYEAALYKTLLDNQPLATLELTRLAKQRVSIIQEALIKNNSVPENQVFVIRPSLNGRAESDKVLTTFSLTTH